MGRGPGHNADLSQLLSREDGGTHERRKTVESVTWELFSATPGRESLKPGTASYPATALREQGPHLPIVPSPGLMPSAPVLDHGQGPSPSRRPITRTNTLCLLSWITGRRIPRPSGSRLPMAPRAG